MMHACMRCILADVDDDAGMTRRIRQICMQHATTGAAHTYAAWNENDKKKNKKRRRKKKIKLSSYFSRSVYIAIHHH